jgi:hypothetical protein
MLTDRSVATAVLTETAAPECSPELPVNACPPAWIVTRATLKADDDVLMRHVERCPRCSKVFWEA